MAFIRPHEKEGFGPAVDRWVNNITHFWRRDNFLDLGHSTGNLPIEFVYQYHKRIGAFIVPAVIALVGFAMASAYFAERTAHYKAIASRCWL